MYSERVLHVQLAARGQNLGEKVSVASHIPSQNSRLSTRSIKLEQTRRGWAGCGRFNTPPKTLPPIDQRTLSSVLSDPLPLLGLGELALVLVLEAVCRSPGQVGPQASLPLALYISLDRRPALRRVLAQLAGLRKVLPAAARTPQHTLPGRLALPARARGCRWTPPHRCGTRSPGTSAEPGSWAVLVGSGPIV